MVSEVLPEPLLLLLLLLEPVELDALLLLAFGVELGVASPLVLDEVELDEESELDAEEDGGVEEDALGELVAVVALLFAVVELAVVELAGMDAISARVPATLTTATPALTAEVRFAPLRALSGVRPAFRAITRSLRFGWCGPWSVEHHPAGAL